MVWGHGVMDVETRGLVENTRFGGQHGGWWKTRDLVENTGSQWKTQGLFRTTMNFPH